MQPQSAPTYDTVRFSRRVAEDGEIGTGDLIECVGKELERMTVSDVTRLLFFEPNDRKALERALHLRALSP